MTEEHGLIGNWLTWQCYTWSHNISHPSCIGSLMHFSISGCTAAEPFHTGVSVDKVMWIKPCCLTRSKPWLQRARVEDDLCMTDADFQASCTSSYLCYMCCCIYPATATNHTGVKKVEQYHLIFQDGCLVSFCGATDCVCWIFKSLTLDR